MKRYKNNHRAADQVSFFQKYFFSFFFMWLGLGAWENVFAGNYKEGMLQYEKGNFQEAFRLIKKAAQEKNAQAEYQLSLMYQKGEGISADKEQAFYWCRRAAHRDHMKAAYAVSKMYQNPSLVEHDNQQAYYWLRRAAELDLENGWLSMALMYLNGELVERDTESAIAWLKHAADKENVIALTLLGKMYEKGQDVEKDEVSARLFFTRAAEKDISNLIDQASALKSRSEARYRLGKMIEEGRGGVSGDEIEAFKWYKKAAEDGNSAAKERLAKFDEIGHL